ncbi:hypothetical protein SGCOL_004936 [Colletotrichum sp. CLE4]
MSSHNDWARSQSPSADDDPDLALAIALSLQQDEIDNDDRAKAASPATQAPTLSVTNTGSLGLLALDRKKMEEERIARLKKRPATEAGIDIQPSQRSKMQRPEASESHKVAVATTFKAISATSATPAANASELPFSKGAFKRTWAYGSPRNGEDIKIEEVLQKDKLQLAVLSSFQWDEEWLLSKVNARDTKMLLVAYANNDAEMVFLIDLPRLNGPPFETPFGTELRRFLRALGLDEKLVKSLDNYDFSETSRYSFIHTISGSHTKEAWQHTGQSTRSARDAMTSCYCGLGNSVRSLGLATDNAVDIDYVASSLGSLNHGFLTTIYYACQALALLAGDSGMKEYEARQSKATKNKAAKTGLVASRPVDIDKEPLQLQHHFRIYFPTEKTVSSSRGGRSSVRSGLLLHSKAIFVRERAHDGAVWAYVGSANLSESAWGRLVKDRESGTAKLSCRNWECGVLVAVKSSSAGTADQGAQGQSRPRTKAQTWTLEGHAESEETVKGKEGTTAAAAESMGKRRHQQLDQDGSVGLDGVFGATMPIPMRVPARRYTSDESAASRPWFFMKAD